MSDGDLPQNRIMNKRLKQLLEFLRIRKKESPQLKKRHFAITVDLFRNQTYRGAEEIYIDTENGEYPNAQYLRFMALVAFQNKGIDCNNAVIRYPLIEMSFEEMEQHLAPDPNLTKIIEKGKAEERTKRHNNKQPYRNPNRTPGGNQKRTRRKRTKTEKK